MTLEFHPGVASDISQIVTYYQEAGGRQLADEFLAELRSCFNRAAEAPRAYARQDGDLQRVNLDRFPYHFLFRVVDNRVRVLVVRHHRRSPTMGSVRR